MEIEKRGGKGGFLHLFDWNGKSRKKLFSSKPESSNQGNGNFHSSVIARPLELEKGFPRNPRDDSSYYSASTIGAESEYGTKAPGVVARLMGLDSLPMQNVNNSPFTPFTESQLCSDSSYLSTALTLHREHEIVIFENVRNKLDGSSINPLDLKLQKAQSRPLERFQKEVLPPKSAKAKPISITQHQLLSPMKSPGFVPPKSAAYIIEAAAKMIEQSPRSNAKSNYQSLRSTSVPYRIRDLKEKMETSQRSFQSADASKRGKEQNSIKNMKRQLNARGQGQDRRKDSDESKRVGTGRSKDKEKSVFLATQGKFSTQKRDRLTLGGNISSEKLKEHNDVKPSCVNRTLTNSKKKVERRSPLKKSSGVLSQKQKCALTEDGEISGSFSSLSKERKEPNMPPPSCIQGRMNRTRIVVNNVVTSRNSNFVADSGKEHSSSRAKTMSKKKRSVNGNIPSGGSVDEKSVKQNVSLEGDPKWNGIDKKNGLDVVSFTFSSPIKKSEAASNSCGGNDSGGDALSLLLEQKLKELTSRVELSQKELSEAASCSSVDNCGSVDSTASFFKSLSMNGDMSKIKAEKESKINGICSNSVLDFQELEHWMGDGDRNVDYQHLKLWSSLSISSQPSLSGASCDPFDVDRSSSNEECDPEISDTASSNKYGTYTPISCITDSEDPSIWELQYIRDMISSADLLWDKFALGEVHKIIAPGLFDRLEDKRVDPCKEHFMLERKVLFDCVCESLEVRCKQLLAGSYKFWIKQTLMLSKRQWLSENLYREISNGEEAMVDDVEKDMNSKYGKWTDFEIEAFEEGVEIEKRILTSLVDELFDDFLL